VGTFASPGALRVAERAAFATASCTFSRITNLKVPAASVALPPWRTLSNLKTQSDDERRMKSKCDDRNFDCHLKKNIQHFFTKK
jgi:hypothetical protein